VKQMPKRSKWRKTQRGKLSGFAVRAPIPTCACGTPMSWVATSERSAKS